MDSTKDNRKVHLVSYGTICIPKREGGLGFGSIAEMNRTLLNKWTYMCCDEVGTFWRRVICEIHNNGEH